MKPAVKIFAVFAAIFSSQVASAADVRPPYASPPYAPSPGAMPRYQPPAPPCFVEFHRFRDGYGRSLIRNGPEDMAVIRHLRYDSGRSLNGRVLSISTGPGTVIELYDARDFRRPMFEIGPGELANLRLAIVDSYRIRCLAPPPPVPAPPAFK